MTIEAGDYVVLPTREAPHSDGPKWWWEVRRVSDYGLDVTFTQGRRVISRRGVSEGLVLDHRKANT